MADSINIPTPPGRKADTLLENLAVIKQFTALTAAEALREAAAIYADSVAHPDEIKEFRRLYRRLRGLAAKSEVAK